MRKIRINENVHETNVHWPLAVFLQSITQWLSSLIDLHDFVVRYPETSCFKWANLFHLVSLKKTTVVLFCSFLLAIGLNCHIDWKRHSMPNVLLQNPTKNWQFFTVLKYGGLRLAHFCLSLSCRHVPGLHQWVDIHQPRKTAIQNYLKWVWQRANTLVEQS